MTTLQKDWTNFALPKTVSLNGAAHNVTLLKMALFLLISRSEALSLQDCLMTTMSTITTRHTDRNIGLTIEEDHQRGDP